MKYTMVFMTRDGKILPFSDGKERRPFDAQELLLRFLVHFVEDVDCYIVSIIIEGKQKRHFVAMNDKGRVGMCDADTKQVYSPKEFMAELRSLNRPEHLKEFFQVCKN